MQIEAMMGYSVRTNRVCLMGWPSLQNEAFERKLLSWKSRPRFQLIPGVLQSDVAHSRQPALQERGDPWLCGCTPSLRGGPELALHTGSVSCGNSTREEELASLNAITCVAETPCGTQICGKRWGWIRLDTITGKEELISSLSELDLPSWAEFLSGIIFPMASFGLWGFFSLCCFSKCPNSLAWAWDTTVPQLQPQSFAICVPHS